MEFMMKVSGSYQSSRRKGTVTEKKLDSTSMNRTNCNLERENFQDSNFFFHNLIWFVSFIIKKYKSI